MLSSAEQNIKERVKEWIKLFSEVNESNKSLAEADSIKILNNINIDSFVKELVSNIQLIKATKNKYLLSVFLKLLSKCSDDIFIEKDRNKSVLLISNITDLFAAHLKCYTLESDINGENGDEYYAFDGVEAMTYFALLERIIDVTLIHNFEGVAKTLHNLHLSLLEGYSNISYISDMRVRKSVYEKAMRLSEASSLDKSRDIVINIRENIDEMHDRMFQSWFEAAEHVDPFSRAIELNIFYDAHPFLLENNQMQQNIVPDLIRKADEHSDYLLQNNKSREWLLFFSEIFVEFLADKKIGSEHANDIFKVNHIIRNLITNSFLNIEHGNIFWPTLMQKFDRYISHIHDFMGTACQAGNATQAIWLGINILDFAGLIWIFGFSEEAHRFVALVGKKVEELQLNKPHYLNENLTELHFDKSIQEILARIRNFYHAQESDSTNIRAELRKYLKLYDTVVTTGDHTILKDHVEHKNLYDAYVSRDACMMANRALTIIHDLESLQASILGSKNPLSATQNVCINQIYDTIFLNRFMPLILSSWIEAASSIHRSNNNSEILNNKDVKLLIKKSDHLYKSRTTQKLQELIKGDDRGYSSIYQAVVFIYHLYLNDYQRMTENGSVIFLKLMIKEMAELLDQLDSFTKEASQNNLKNVASKIFDIYVNKELIQKYVDAVCTEILSISSRLNHDEDFRSDCADDLSDLLYTFTRLIGPLFGVQAVVKIQEYLEQFISIGILDADQKNKMGSNKKLNYTTEHSLGTFQDYTKEMADYFIQCYFRKEIYFNSEMKESLFDELSTLNNLLEELNRLNFENDNASKYIALFEVTLSLMKQASSASAILSDSNLLLLKILKQWNTLFTLNVPDSDGLYALRILANAAIHQLTQKWFQNTTNIKKVKRDESKIEVIGNSGQIPHVDHHNANVKSAEENKVSESQRKKKAELRKQRRKLKKQDELRQREEQQKNEQEASRQKAVIEAAKIEAARIKQEKQKAELDKAEAERARIAAQEKQRRRDYAEQQMRLAEARKMEIKIENERIRKEKKQLKRLEKANQIQVQDKDKDKEELCDHSVIEKVQDNLQNLVIEESDIYASDHQYEISKTIMMPAHLSFVMKSLSEKGFRTYCVGGFPRDSILRSDRPSSDYDIVTEAPKEVIEEALNSAILLEGRHSNIKPRLREVPAIRGLYKYRTYDFLVKESGFDLKSDAENRDFTINTLYVSWCGRILMPLSNACSDLSMNMPIKAIGDPLLKFKQDPVKILRAIDLSTKLGRDIDQLAIRAIKRNAYRLGELPYEVTIVHIAKLFASGRSLQNFQKIFDLCLLYPMLKLLGSDIHSYIMGEPRLHQYILELWGRLDQNNIHDRNGALAILLFPAVLKEMTPTLSFQDSITSLINDLVSEFAHTDDPIIQTKQRETVKALRTQLHLLYDSYQVIISRDTHSIYQPEYLDVIHQPPRSYIVRGPVPPAYPHSNIPSQPPGLDARVLEAQMFRNSQRPFY